MFLVLLRDLLHYIKPFYSISSSPERHFGIFWSSFWVMPLYYWELFPTVSYEILYRCFSYNSDSQYTYLYIYFFVRNQFTTFGWQTATFRAQSSFTIFSLCLHAIGFMLLFSIMYSIYNLFLIVLRNVKLSVSS